MQIKTKLIISFAVIILIFSAGSLYSISQNRAELIDNVGKNSITFSRDISDRLDQQVHVNIVQLSLLASAPLIKNFVSESNQEFENIEDIQNYLDTTEEKWHSYEGKENPIYNELSQNFLSMLVEDVRQQLRDVNQIDIFPEILVTNKHGATIAANGRTTDWDQSDRLQFKNARDQGWHVSDLYYDKSAEVWALEIAVPIKDDDGNFVGMIKTAYNIDDVIAILLDSTEESPYNNVGFHLATQDARIIYSTQEGLEIGSEISQETFDLFSLDEDFFPLEWFGDKKWVAYSTSDGFRDFPGFSWIIVMSIPESEFLTQIDRIQTFLFIILLISTAIGIVASILTTKAFSSPIAKVIYTMREIGKGNFDSKVEIKNKDEIGEIGIMVNDVGEELKKAEQQKNEIAAMITHELKTPLVPIQGYCNALKNPKFGPLNEDQKDAVDEIFTNSQQLLGLIQNVLNAQKIEAHGMKYNMNTINVDEFVARIMKTLEHYTKEKNIEFTESVEKAVSIKGDKDRLMEVFNNIVANAVDFTPADTGKIHIDGKIVDNMIQFSITDNGIGIPKDKQKGMFKKFYQVDTSATRKHGGSGLGLAICKGYVEDHGGKIWLESDEGKGSTFLFTIPLIK